MGTYCRSSRKDSTSRPAISRLAAVLVIIAVAVLAWPGASAQAEVFKYGYTTAAGNIFASISPNFLMGVAIYVPQELYLTDVGIITKGFDPLGKVGIYADIGSGPAALVAQTAPFHLPANTDTQIPVITPVTLSVGTYWFMANFDDPGAQLGGPGDFNVPSKYVALDYNSALPASYPAHSTFSQIPPSYYLVGLPEPATLSLLAIGGIALLRRRSA